MALPFLSLARLCGVTAGAFVATAMSVGYLYETAEAHIEAPTIKSARVLTTSPTPLPQLEAKAMDIAVRVPVAPVMADTPPHETVPEAVATAAPQAAQPSAPIEVVALQQGRWVEAGQGVKVWENAPAEGWTLVGSAD